MKLAAPSNLNPNTPSVAVTLSNSALFGFTVNVLLPSLLTKSPSAIKSFETLTPLAPVPVKLPLPSILIVAFLSPVGVVVV